jgi:hypothetical protein
MVNSILKDFKLKEKAYRKACIVSQQTQKDRDFLKSKGVDALTGDWRLDKCIHMYKENPPDFPVYFLLQELVYIDKVLRESIIFYISEKSQKDIVDYSWNKNNYMGNGKNVGFKDIKIPYNMAVTFEDNDFYFTVDRLDKDDLNNIIINLAIEGQKFLGVIINITKLPRIFILCSGIAKCTKALIIPSISDNWCVKTLRTCSQCDMFYESTLGGLNLIKAERAMHSFLMLYEIMKRFNKQPTLIRKVREGIKQRNLNTSTYSPSVNDSMGIIHLKDTRFVYESLEKVPSGITRSEPCEHYRRDSIRHLKSGKIIKVRGTIVNKGKEKKMYEI